MSTPIPTSTADLLTQLTALITELDNTAIDAETLVNSEHDGDGQVVPTRERVFYSGVRVTAEVTRDKLVTLLAQAISIQRPG
jgi:hypothetical protein